MEKICRNCKYFRFTKMSIEEELRCGNCQKPGTPVTVVDGVPKGGVFKWDNDTCKAFKPNKNSMATRSNTTEGKTSEM